MKVHPFNILTLDNGAQLIFTPCPRTKETSLEEGGSYLQQAGTQMLATSMFDEEIAKNNAELLLTVFSRQGIAWVQLPMPDDAVPNEAFESRWQANKADILSVINNKGTIAVHYNGGSGRTALAIGLMLLAFGWSGNKVLTEVQKSRPKPVNHPLQLDYFNSYL